jgi:hypothetical protein
LQKSGHLTYFNPASKNYYILDSTYNLIDSVGCQNGYEADWHEFIYLPNKHAYLISHDDQHINLSLYDSLGNAKATVTGLVIQQLDENKEIVFQWRSWDYFQFSDALHYYDPTLSYVSYVHGNSLDVDSVGNILLSCYQMDEITKINGRTGDIIWRLGGKNNEFTFLNDTVRFTTQHDARLLPNGNITLFNNANFISPKVTSVNEYKIDETLKTAELVWSFAHPLNFHCPRSGNAQRLPNGNTFINWGWKSSASYPSFTEVSPDGTIVYDAAMESSQHLIYRAHKYPWKKTTDIYAKNIPLNNPKIYVYPNPASSKINIALPNQNEFISSASLLRVDGTEIRIAANEDMKSFNVTNIPSGVYFLSVITNISHYKSKLIVVN